MDFQDTNSCTPLADRHMYMHTHVRMHKCVSQAGWAVVSGWAVGGWRLASQKHFAIVVHGCKGYAK